MTQQPTPAGWYHAQGDPPGTTRYWDGAQWVGEPQFSQPSNFGSDPVAGQGGYTPALEPVGGWARIGGRVIDGIIWGILTLLASIPLLSQIFSTALDSLETGNEVVEPEISTPLLVVTSLLGMVLVAAYETVGNAKWGGTLGKQAISARVVKADGSNLDLAASFRRMWLYIGISLAGIVYEALVPGAAASQNNAMDGLFGLIALAGLIMLFAQSRRQTPWDLVGDTIVVRKNRF